MANKILIKSKVGGTGDASAANATIGELAVNTYDGKLFVGTNIGTATDTGDSHTYVAGEAGEQASWVGAPIDTTATLGTSNLKLATQGAIKTYVDTEVAAAESGLDFKDSVIAASIQAVLLTNTATASRSMAITTATTVSSLTSLGGTVAEWTALFDAALAGEWNVLGARVLLMTCVPKDGGVAGGAASGPTTDAANGVYKVTQIMVDSGTVPLILLRDDDFDSAGASGDVSSGAYVFVEQGGTLANNSYVVKSSTNWGNDSYPDDLSAAITNTTSDEILFAQFSGAGQIIAGTNLTKTGDTLDVDDAFLKNNADDSTSHALTILGATGLTINDATTTGTGEGGNLVLASDDDTVMVDTHRLGVIEFKGAEDTSNTLSVGAKIQAVANGTWAGSANDGILQFFTTNGTTQTKVLELDEAQLATFSGQVIGTGFTGTLDGVLGGGTPAAATVSSLDAGSGDIKTTGLVTTDRLKLEGGTFDTILDPGTPTADVTYTWPLADGSSGQVLSTAGNGTLSWATDAVTAPLTLTTDDAVVNDVTTVLTLQHTNNGSGTLADNVGVGMDFSVETTAGVTELGMQIEAIASDNSAATEDFDFSVKLMANGQAAAEMLNVSSVGDITFGGTLNGGSF